jgi:hypothetical protein
MSKHKILDSYTIERKMPENYVEGELDFCRKEFSYKTYDVQLLELKNCVINKKGFVYEQDKFMLNKLSLLDEKRYTQFLNVKHYIKKVLIKKKRALGSGKYLLAFDEWTNEHYHWFCDLLPRLFAVKEIIKDYILILPDSNYSRNIGLQSLDFFELRPAGIEFIKDHELVKVKNLALVTHTCLTGYINDKIIQDMKHFINSKLDFTNATNKIYVTRDKARYRKVLNETEIWDVVKGNDYEIVRYEDMSWKDQILKAASSQSIVSMHGAGLVNVFYMPNNGSVLEFRRDKIYHNQCFWHLSAALKLNYYYLLGTPDRDDLVLEGGDCCNLTINPELLDKTLKLMDIISGQ